MFKQLTLAALFAALSVSFGYTQSNTTLTIPVDRHAAGGQQMYASYCAPCHGADGRGNGPAASALKKQPIDLTMLSKNNAGKFPAEHVVTVLQFGSELPAHGSSQMPIWGPILGTMNRSNPQAKALKISNLSGYLRSIQMK